MHTITSPRQIDALFKRGRKASEGLLVLLVEPREGEQGRVLFVAGRRLGGAVMRNRCKRVLREACRRAGGPWDGYDVVLISRPGTGTASPQQIDAQLGRLLDKLSVRG